MPTYQHERFQEYHEKSQGTIVSKRQDQRRSFSDQTDSLLPFSICGQWGYKGELFHMLIDQKIDVRWIPISAIHAPLKDNSRNIGSVEDLMVSIREKGLLQPIIVRDAPNFNYELIAGFRRLKACKLLGWDTIPAIVREDRDKLVVQLIENLQRKNPSDLEVALALEKLKGKSGMSHTQIGKRIGKKSDWIARRFAYLAIIRELQGQGVLYEKLKKVPLSSMRKLYRLSTESKIEMVNRIIENDMGQREIVEKVAKEYPQVNLKYPSKTANIEPKEFKPHPKTENNQFSIIIQGEMIRLLFSNERQFRNILELLKNHGGVVI
jgi:ParB/RepB/Spo0J family partition protein